MHGCVSHSAVVWGLSCPVALHSTDPCNINSHIEISLQLNGVGNADDQSKMVIGNHRLSPTAFGLSPGLCPYSLTYHGYGKADLFA